LTEEQRNELPKNVITRALGMQDQVVVDLQHDDPHPGDVYVLCSDGLSGMVTDDDIQHIITGSADIRDACRSLIARANEKGGEDNVTAVVIRIEDDGGGDATQTQPPVVANPPQNGQGPAVPSTTLPVGDNFGDEPTMPGTPGPRK